MRSLGVSAKLLGKLQIQSLELSLNGCRVVMGNVGFSVGGSSVKKSDKSSKKMNTVVTTTQETLTSEEERVLRLRSGYVGAEDMPLESKLDEVAEEHRTDVSARLALIQAEVLAQLAQRKRTPSMKTERQRSFPLFQRLKTTRDR